MAFARESFEEAFSDQCAGAHRTCACGKEYYDSYNAWYWEEGELEQLQADPNATDLGYSVCCLTLQGNDYVLDCDCWLDLAEKAAAFITAHGDSIAEFLRLEKARKVAKAQAMPTVDEQPCQAGQGE